MKSRFRRFIMVVAFPAFLLLGYILLKGHKEGQMFHKTSQLQNTATHKDTKSDENKELQINHYVAVNDSSLIGKNFNLDLPTKIMVQSFFKEPNTVSIDPNAPFLASWLPSQVHRITTIENLRWALNISQSSFQKQEWFSTILGSTTLKSMKLSSYLFLAYRKFDFDAYPPHVRNLHNYAGRFGGIWRSHVVWHIDEVSSEYDPCFGANGSLQIRNIVYVRSTGHSIL